MRTAHRSRAIRAGKLSGLVVVAALDAENR
jgi:hypothetical protein